jgi:uncharacterized protein (DUF3820 family)
MDDNSKMPFGKHQGEKLANVPPEYLLWLYENAKLYGELKEYVEDNMFSIKEEIKYNQKKQK